MRQEIAVPEIGLTINNQPILLPDRNGVKQDDDVRLHRLGSPLFNLLLRENNILDIPVEAGKTLLTVGLAEGYWIMLKFVTCPGDSLQGQGHR